MIKKNTDRKFGLAFHIIGRFVIMLVLFSAVSSSIGYASFTDSFKKEYATSTYHMADTAATLVNGDSIDSYLTDGENEEYLQTAAYLNGYCKKMSVSLIYVIKVDTSDYGRFESVFNAVDNTVDDTSYSQWELGHKRDTTNDEYREKYKALYNNEEKYETVYRTTNLHGQHPHITTMVPVRNSDGSTVAILCIQRPMRELDDAGRPYLMNIVLSTIGMIVIAGVTSSFLLNRSFVTPIKMVSDEATRFAKENTQSDKLGAVSRITEISNLSVSIDTMEEDMMRYIDNLTALNAEKERAKTELSIATTIQQNSVPDHFPAFPDRSDFEIFASMTSAKEVGGDFYNFFLIDDDHLAIVIGDVSGKGVPAALFMMVTNILLSDRTQMGGTPAEILTFVNNNICEHNRAEMFVTLWLGILELSSGKLTAANAGHDDAAIYRANSGDFEFFKTRHGIVAGAMHGITYKNFEIQLTPGDKIFLYTDGVPEATDADNNMFGMGRTLNALNQYGENTPEGILKGVNDSVSEFVGEAPQFDDLTMLCLHYKGKDAQTASEAADEITLPAIIENIQAATEFVNSHLESMDCPIKVQTQIDIAIDEIFSNIANYAYGEGTGAVTLRMTTAKDNRGVELTFINSGIPYDPLKKPDPDTTLSADERSIGGLGIFLVKKTMDEMTYEYSDSQNRLTLRKFF